MKKGVKGYIFSRSFMGERVPQSVQNLFLREYCKRKKLKFLLSSVEYCMESSFIHLNNIINNLNTYDGILVYSLFQFPQDANNRTELLKKIIIRKKKVFFAIEDIVVENYKSIDKVNDIWAIKLTLENKNFL